MLALAHGLLGAAALRHIAGDVDDADRHALGIAQERRRRGDVDARPVRGAPGHVLFEHAHAVQQLAGADPLAVVDDRLQRLADEVVLAVAEHRAGGAVGHADLRLQVDDEHGALHRRQHLRRGELRRELHQAVAPDRVRGEADEGE